MLGTMCFHRTSILRKSVPRIDTNSDRSIELYTFSDLYTFPDQSIDMYKLSDLYTFPDLTSVCVSNKANLLGVNFIKALTSAYFYWCKNTSFLASNIEQHVAYL